MATLFIVSEKHKKSYAMNKIEYLESITGFYFADEDSNQKKEANFDKLFAGLLSSSEIDYLYRWGLHLQRVNQGKSKTQTAKDKELAKVIVEYGMAIQKGNPFLQVNSGNRTLVEIRDKDTMKAILESLKKLWVQKYRWDGWSMNRIDWVLKDISEDTKDFILEKYFYYYDNGSIFYSTNSNIGRPQKNQVAKKASWMLNFILSLDEKEKAFSLTNQKISIITDFLLFFNLFDFNLIGYGNEEEKKKYRNNSIKSMMDYYRKSEEGKMIIEECSIILEDYAGDGEADAAPMGLS